MNFKGMCPVVLISFVFIVAGSASMMVGGPSETKPATEDVQRLVEKVQGDLESLVDKQFTTFRAISFKTQVVAGVNYFVKVEVDAGDILYLRVYVPLPHTQLPPSLHSYRSGSAADTDIPFF